jgi:hypothetical protein
LPQITGGYGAPFARGYNPQLAEYGLEQDDFLNFLDALNIAMAPSSPLYVIGTAGLIMGCFPYHWAMIAGTLTQTVAQTALYVIRKILTDRLLKRANSTYFQPRGLKIRLMGTGAMRRFLGLDAGDSKPSKAMRIAKSVGHGIENVAYRLPIPFVGRVVSARNKPSNIDPNSTDNFAERRMADLKGYIAPISFDVPPAKATEALMDKASKLCIKFRLWQGKQADAKAMRNRRLLAIAEGRDQPEYGGADEYQGPRTRRAERMARHRRRQARKLRGEVAKADKLELNATSDLVWVVIMNADQEVALQLDGRSKPIPSTK